MIERDAFLTVVTRDRQSAVNYTIPVACYAVDDLGPAEEVPGWDVSDDRGRKFRVWLVPPTEDLRRAHAAEIPYLEPADDDYVGHHYRGLGGHLYQISAHDWTGYWVEVITPDESCREHLMTRSVSDRAIGGVFHHAHLCPCGWMEP